MKRGVGPVASLVVALVLVGVIASFLPLAASPSAKGLALDASAIGYSTGGTSSSCSLTTSSSPDVIYVAISETSPTDLFASISDGGSLSWSQRGSFLALSSVSGQRAEYAIASTTLSSDTITVTMTSGNQVDLFCVAISGASTGSPFDGSQSQSSSSTSSASSPNFLTTSNANDFLIGSIASSNPPGTVSQASGNICLNGCNPAGPYSLAYEFAEYQIVSSTGTYNEGFAGDRGFAYVGIADAIRGTSSTTSTTSSSTSTSSSTTTSTTTSTSTSTVHLTCTMSNGAPADSVSLSEASGSSLNPTSAPCDGNPHTITTDPSVTLTATVGSCTPNCEHRFNPSGSLVATVAIATPSSGGSESWSFHDYLLLGSNYAASANAQTDFDTGMSCTVIGTVGGNSSSSNSISSTLAASDSATLYFDYGTRVTFCSTFSSAPANTQWMKAGTYQFTDTAGGKTHVVQYWKQLYNTYRATPTNPIAWDAALSIPVTGTILGSAGRTGCVLSTVVNGGAVQCSAYFDYNSQVTIASPVKVSSTEHWSQGCGTAGRFQDTTGGNLENCNYSKHVGP